MSELLKTSLYRAYRDSPEILDLFDQLDFTKLTVQFNQELYSRITPDEQTIVENILASDIVKRYDVAVASAVLAVTRPLADLLDLVLVQNETGKLN